MTITVQNIVRACSLCRKEKALTEFAKHKHNPTGYGYTCKFCNRMTSARWRQEHPTEASALFQKGRLRRLCNITEDDVNAALLAQDYKCAMCGEEPKPDKRGIRFHIDHDHATGKFRGMLCRHCNLGVGHFFDNPDKLLKAAYYLENNLSTK